MSHDNLPTKADNTPTFSKEKVELIKRTVAKGATDDELQIFMHQAKKTGLDPLAKQIYFQKYKTKEGPRMSIITGIDGYRLVAHRTGTYAGVDPTKFEGEKFEGEVNVPVVATVTVYKIVQGHRCPFTASARWDQYYPGGKLAFMWRKMPHLMLEKCAEALALRKAFPAELSGVYTAEEMHQADQPASGARHTVQGEVIEPGSDVPVTDKQRKLLYAWMKNKGWDNSIMSLFLKYQGFGESLKEAEIYHSQMDQLLEDIESVPQDIHTYVDFNHYFSENFGPKPEKDEESDETETT